MGDGFVTVYKRHTPFSMVQHIQPVTDKITIQPRGDLVSYVYLTKTDLSTGMIVPWDWEDILEFEWWIGDRMIDRQDVNFIRYVYPTFMARTYSKAQYDPETPLFLPLTFSFCDLPFPIVSLNYHSFDIKIKKGSTFDSLNYGYQCHINYIHLDESERLYFAMNKHIIPVHKVTKIDNITDVQLNYPVKFIATPKIKIPKDFQYSVKINNRVTRGPEHYTGSELVYHTEYAKTSPTTSDPFPPLPLTGENTFLTTAYGRGVYTVMGTSTNANNYPWNASDNVNSYWQTSVFTEADVQYIATASSNVENAWRAFSSNTVAWVSNASYGTLLTYIVQSSSGDSNAWMEYWTTNVLYGINVSNAFTYGASSNTTDIANAFDGNTATYWVSDLYKYASDISGYYNLRASSAKNSNVVDAFTGNSSWVSNATYGVYPVATVTTTKPNVFSVTNVYTSTNVFGRVTPSFTVTVSTSSGNVLPVFDGSEASWWISNTSYGTYGFSSYAGNYKSNSTSNTSASWLAFDGNSATQWTSNSVYFKKFNGSYNVSASSNVSNAWLSTDAGWIHDEVFGIVRPGGVYSISANSNAIGFVYTTVSQTPTRWAAGQYYGTVLGSNTFVATASSNTANAWRAFSSSFWTSSEIFGQIRFKAGSYVETVSSGTTANIFGNVGSWVSNVGFGFTLPSGVYTVSNSSANSIGMYSNTGSWGGPTFYNNVDEFFTTVDLGRHTITSSSNVGNAWMAFSNTSILDFNVDSYKTYIASAVVFSSSPGGTVNDTLFQNATGNLIYTSAQNYADRPVGTYTVSNTFSFDNNPTTFWTPTNEFTLDNGTVNNPSETVTVTFPKTIETYSNIVINDIDQYVTSVTGGYGYSMVLDKTGNVWSFGRNAEGQLGLGDNTRRTIPTRVTFSNAISVSCGNYQSMILDKFGNVYVFGTNSNGQLGLGYTGGSLNTPTYLTGNVTSISCGFQQSMILDRFGNLWSFGGNDYGQLGLGDTTPRNVPTRIALSNITSISGLGGHYLTLDKFGNVWSFGYNNEGQLGLGNTSNVFVPTRISISNIVSVSGGVNHSLVLDNTGNVWSFGWNAYGQLGLGDTTDRLVPTLITSNIVSNAVAISAGGNHSMVLDKFGNVWSFGNNSVYNQLGLGDSIDRNVPTRITSNIVSLSLIHI